MPACFKLSHLKIQDRRKEARKYLPLLPPWQPCLTSPNCLKKHISKEERTLTRWLLLWRHTHTDSFFKHREQSLPFKEINILAYFRLLKEKFSFSTRTLRYPLSTFQTIGQFCRYVALNKGKPGSSFLTTSQHMWHTQELKAAEGE